MKDETLGGELSFVNHAVNHTPKEKDKELPRLFDEVARISEKRDIDISLHMTFSEQKRNLAVSEKELPNVMGNEGVKRGDLSYVYG